MALGRMNSKMGVPTIGKMATTAMSKKKRKNTSGVTSVIGKMDTSEDSMGMGYVVPPNIKVTLKPKRPIKPVSKKTRIKKVPKGQAYGRMGLK